MIVLLIVAVVGMLLTLFVLAGEFSKESDSTTTPITRQTIPDVTLPPDPTVPTVPTTTGDPAP
jgi:hypothetical protein